MKLVREKVETGDIETVTQPEESEGLGNGAQILDLTELLQRSLKKGGGKEEREKPLAENPPRPAPIVQRPQPKVRISVALKKRS